MLLFLDFDGVMHPVGCTIDRYFCHAHLLEGWLRQRPGVDVVISSSWRETYTFDVIESFFAEDLQQRIVGVTPIIRAVHDDGGGEQGEREAEVMQWLSRSREPLRPWVALDDMSWLFRPQCQRLVLCDPEVGLTPAALDQADLVLRAPHLFRPDRELCGCSHQR